MSRMRRAEWLCAIGLVLAMATVSGQTAPGAALSDTLRAHLADERFDVVTSVRGLPLGVRDELQTLWRTSTLDIAEPGGQFQDTGARANPSLPARRLVAAGCSLDYHCLIYYERGGSDHAWLVLLFRWTPAESRLEMGGVAPSGLKTIDEVRGAVLSGRIGRNDRW